MKDLSKLLTIFLIVIGVLIGGAILINNYILFIPYSTSNIISSSCILIGIVMLLISVIPDNWLLKSLIGIVGVGLIASPFIISSPLINTDKHRNLIGEVKQSELTKDLEVADKSKLPIINPEYASNLANKKLGESALGSQYTIGNLTLQLINEEMYYVAPLEFTGFFKWLDNGVSPGYVKISASKDNDVELITELNGEKIGLKYLDSAYFSKDLNRKIFNHNKNVYTTSYTFELDDNGKPYWVATRYERKFLLSGKVANGVTLLDPITGNIKEYDLKDVPNWVDCVEPYEFTKSKINDWGQLVHGIFNFSDKDMLKTTEGHTMLVNNGKLYYYTGITSSGSDTALHSFALTDTRTGQTAMYKASGAIESVGVQSAETLYKASEFRGTYPILINLFGEPTYFVTLIDENSLVKAYSFVNIKSYNKVGHGTTLNDAYNNYAEVLNKNEAELNDKADKKTLKGIVERVSVVENSVYMIVKDNKKPIIAPASNFEAALTNVGDEITGEYYDNNNAHISLTQFDNLALDYNNIKIN